MLESLIVMTDHRVGCIDGFVKQDARQAGNGIPKKRGNDAIGKVFSKAFNGRFTNARFIQPGNIAANDHRYFGTPCSQPPRLQGTRDPGDVIVKASLGDQHRHQSQFYSPAQPPKQAYKFADNNRHDTKSNEKRRACCKLSSLRSCKPKSCGKSGKILPVSEIVEAVDNPAHEHDRMGHPAPQPVRVTHENIYQQG